MAHGTKTGGRDFKSGDEWTGNRKGRPAYPADLKGVKSLTRQELELRLKKMLDLPVTEIKRLMRTDSMTGMDKFILSIVYKGIVCGDAQRFGFLLDRMIGKVKDQVEISSPKPIIIDKLDGEKEVLTTEDTV